MEGFNYIDKFNQESIQARIADEMMMANIINVLAHTESYALSIEDVELLQRVVGRHVLRNASMIDEIQEEALATEEAYDEMFGQDDSDIDYGQLNYQPKKR